MSVNDEEEFPWLISEKEFIRECILLGKSVLGICLGAQLIAHVMGARVYRNRYKEIGWFPVQGIPSNNSSFFSFPPMFEAFHWHGETFDLPPGAVHLARSAGCENQAFQLGRSVIGLQFHLETTPASAMELLTHNRAEILRSKYVESEELILGTSDRRYKAINELMFQVLSFVTSTAG
jgi:GMP synthase-like glutamine amidotransferase